jgi:hypothetical protein
MLHVLLSSSIRLNVAAQEAVIVYGQLDGGWMNRILRWKSCYCSSLHSSAETGFEQL